VDGASKSFGRIIPYALVIGLLTSTPASAAVVAAGASGFISEHELLLPADSDKAYRALTTDIAAWWDASHSYSGKAENFSMDARAGGCFCESLPNGGSVMHMQVVFADPGRLLRLSGGLGPLQGMGVSGSMDFVLEPAEGQEAASTVLRYRYVVHGLAESGVGEMADAVDQVQAGQLQRFKAYLSGK